MEMVLKHLGLLQIKGLFDLFPARHGSEWTVSCWMLLQAYRTQSLPFSAKALAQVSCLEARFSLLELRSPVSRV